MGIHNILMTYVQMVQIEGVGSFVVRLGYLACCGCERTIHVDRVLGCIEIELVALLEWVLAFRFRLVCVQAGFSPTDSSRKTWYSELNPVETPALKTLTAV